MPASWRSWRGFSVRVPREARGRGSATRNALWEKGWKVVTHVSSAVPAPALGRGWRTGRKLCLRIPRAAQGGGSGGERCLFEQPAMLGGPWCPSISRFLLSWREREAGR